jgi:acyl-[acyl carrier protein]--UDP-N-acetylglucosamine O-acyltransferase
VAIDASRIAQFYINGALVSTSTALTNATDLKPYLGVQANTGAARSINIIGQAISRKVA